MIHPTPTRLSKQTPLLVLLIGGLTAGLGVGLFLQHRTPTRNGLVYNPKGLGGWSTPEAKRTTPLTTLEKAVQAYQSGQYAEVETLGRALVETAEKPGASKAALYEELEARRLLAYSAARQKDFSLAETRFADLRDAADRRPDHGKQKQELGQQPLPTFAEEGEFQRIVCLNKLQGPKVAEIEYNRFLKEHPDSQLIHATVKRIARFHEGDIPRPSENLWFRAMKIQKTQEEGRQREAALCGPACLAEVLRRQGQSVQTHALAKEMGTTGEGTSLESLSKAAQAHGLAGEGVRLKFSGLQKQTLPLVALMAPGHFVLVEAVSEQGVKVWDPNGKGVNQPEAKELPRAEWEKSWQGIALTL